MTEPNRLPLRHQFGGAQSDPFQKLGIGVGRRKVFCVKVIRNDEICQLLQMFKAIGRCIVGKMFEVPKSNEAGRGSGHNGRCFKFFTQNGQRGAG